MYEPERNFTTEELKTHGSKEFAIYKVSNTSLFRVGFVGGGQTPKELEGSWTDPVMAQKAIKIHLTKIELIAQAKLDKEAANRAANVKVSAQKKSNKQAA